MMHVHSVLFLGLLEACAVSVLALLGLTVLAIVRRRRQGKAVAALIAGVKESAGPRRDAICSTLGGDEEPSSDHRSAAIGIERARKLLLKELIRIYATRDTKAIAALVDLSDTLVDGVLDAAMSIREPGAPAEAPESLHEEIGRLEAANEKLQAELRATRQTMSNMLEEYARIYDREGAENLPTVAAPTTTPIEDSDLDLEAMFDTDDGPDADFAAGESGVESGLEVEAVGATPRG